MEWLSSSLSWRFAILILSCTDIVITITVIAISHRSIRERNRSSLSRTTIGPSLSDRYRQLLSGDRYRSSAISDANHDRLSTSAIRYRDPLSESLSSSLSRQRYRNSSVSLSVDRYRHAIPDISLDPGFAIIVSLSRWLSHTLSGMLSSSANRDL
ncbi:hypothetical protein Tco_0962145 [Tanacetum coccineum]